METPDRTSSTVDPETASRDALQDALRDLAEELLAPTAVLQSYGPRLATTVERGDSSALIATAEVIERNAANLEAVLKSWEGRFPSQPGKPFSGPAPPGSETPRAEVPDDLWQIVVHEVRSPVAVIQGCAATLKTALDYMDSVGLAKMSGAIERGAMRLGELVGSFENVDALARGEMNLQHSEVELGGLVGQIVRDLEAITHPHPVSVVVGDKIPATVDPLRLRQVLTNLLSNAAKFSKATTPIRVEVGRSGEGATISVVDRGPGVPPEGVGELFEKFSRLDERVSGMGLGLYVSRAIAQAHGGDLTVTHPHEGGACFVLWLPLVRP